MSAISLALDGMQKRMAAMLPAGFDLRVFPLAENKRKAALLITAVLVLGGLAAWGGWRWQHKAPAAPVKVAAKPAAAPKAELQPHVPPQPAAPEAHEKEPVAQKEGEHKADEHKADALVPGIKSETAIIPPPAVLHGKPLAANAEERPHKAAKRHRSTHAPANIAAGGTDEPSEHQAPAATPGGKLDKRTKQIGVQQQADNEFRKAVASMQQGHINDALAGYEAALRLDAGHDAARQAMVALLLENRRIEDAERVLKEGLKNNIKHSGFAMVLARVQVEREAPWSAVLTLQRTLPYASQQADYQAFLAALLQRLSRHKEAVAHYQKALQLSPNSGVWLMGQAISLQALERKDEARDAFKRAMETHTLNEDLQAFVAQRLKEL